MYKFSLFILILTHPAFVLGMEIDNKLKLVAQVYNLAPKTCEKRLDSDKNARVKAGELLFKSVILSGDRDISCANCHLDEFGSADGLPIAVGVGGEGEGLNRIYNSKGVLVQRNALSLEGRADAIFSAYFWDGKVQKDAKNIYTQFGDKIKGTILSPLAAAAILPLVERDEFLGQSKILTSNEYQWATRNSYYYDRYQSLSSALKTRLINKETEEDKKVYDALVAANVDMQSFELATVGNLLAEFIGFRFPCKENAWDKYLNGNQSALNADEKEGAILFYGKGRCASCHSGQFFSDFQYHSIGTPQGAFGPHSRHRDIGRAGVTNRQDDLYLFRTPPLTGVSKTAPYGHNGIFTSIREAVVHHFNPLDFYIKHPEVQELDYYINGKLLGSRSKLLTAIDLKSDEELDNLVKFVNKL